MGRPGKRTRAPHGATAATPIAFVKAILCAYERGGVSPRDALRRGRIPPELLGDPQARITARQMEDFTEAAMRELDDEALGWFSRRLPWGSLGMLCRASLPSPDLEVALKRWFRHHRLLVDDVELRLSVEPGRRATVAIVERRDLGGFRELCLLSYLRYVHGYACWVVDSRISLLGVGLPFPRPPHGAVYPLLFPGPVSFDAAAAHMTFDARYLALPQRRDDAALRVMLGHALPLTVLPYRRDRLLAARVRRLLSEHPDLRDAEAIARHLHVSTRTLHRHLAHEGVSVQGLKDEVRRERAVELLSRTERPLKQVAAAVGYRDEKSFSRAFRQWTGRSPGEVRRRGPGAG